MKKYEGDDLVNSLLILFNRTLITSKMPTSKEDMKMTSAFEKKGSKQELDKRRGLLIIDIISKMFGENYEDQNDLNDIKVTLSPYLLEVYQVKVRLTVLTHSVTSLIFIFFSDYRSGLKICDSETLFNLAKANN